SPGSSLLAIGSLVPIGPVSEPRLISVRAPSFDDSRWLSRLLAHVGEDSTAVANPSKPTRGRRVNHATTSYGSSARAVSFRLNFPLRLFAGRDAEAIFSAVSEHYGLDRSALAHRGDLHIARAVAAWLCRRHSEDPLRELRPPAWPVSCRQRPQPD